MVLLKQVKYLYVLVKALVSLDQRKLARVASKKVISEQRNDQSTSDSEEQGFTISDRQY